GLGLAVLATARRDGAPRLHPVCPVLSNDRLFVLVTPISPKRHDLVRDGRYALQTFPQPRAGSDEFYVAGKASLVEAPAVRDAVFRDAKHMADASEVLFELWIDRVMHTRWENVNAIPAGTPLAYGRIVEWKGKPEVDIFWGGESALFEKLADQKLLQKVDIARESWESIPASIGKPKPIPLKDRDGYWVGTALEPYGLVYHPKKIQRLGMAEPKEWDDLLNPKLKGEVAQCAPTRSSSSNATYEVILSMYGEDKGWDWLKTLAANTGHFTARSRDVPTVVAKGEY